MSRGNVLTFIWQNFKRSLRPRQVAGNFMGEDYLGNKYYEIPRQPQFGQRRPERWFEPPGNNMNANFDSELTAEWQSWLRHRRAEPPTDEELKHNLAIMQMKKINAAELEAKFSEGKEPDERLKITTGLSGFPTYDEYETVVGRRPQKKDDKTDKLLKND